jgi:pyruvate-formate lyase-activating enzyme
MSLIVALLIAYAGLLGCLLILWSNFRKLKTQLSESNDLKSIYDALQDDHKQVVKNYKKLNMEFIEATSELFNVKEELQCWMESRAEYYRLYTDSQEQLSAILGKLKKDAKTQKQLSDRTKASSTPTTEQQQKAKVKSTKKPVVKKAIVPAKKVTKKKA